MSIAILQKSDMAQTSVISIKLTKTTSTTADNIYGFRTTFDTVVNCRMLFFVPLGLCMFAILMALEVNSLTNKRASSTTRCVPLAASGKGSEPLDGTTRQPLSPPRTLVALMYRPIGLFINAPCCLGSASVQDLTPQGGYQLQLVGGCT